MPEGRNVGATTTRKTGKDIERKGNASRAADAAVQTRCRAAADRPRSKFTVSHVAPSTAILLSAVLTKSEYHADSFQPNILLSLPLSFFDHFRHLVQVLAREALEIGRASCRERV